MTTLLDRRDFSIRLAALTPGLVYGVSRYAREGDEEVSHSAEAIHQEVAITASSRRIYEALTDAAQFTKVTTFSSVPNAPPARIGQAAGDAFSIFGGHIIGRHVELLPHSRIVQAWRVVDWDPGVYSIARFEISERDGQTTVVFDHTGFPKGQAEHLAEGWKQNYWQPLMKYFG